MKELKILKIYKSELIVYELLYKESHAIFHRIKHDCPGVVTLANNGSDMFDAEFVVTARELKPLDDRNLAIGYVTQGLDFLESVTETRLRFIA